MPAPVRVWIPCLLLIAVACPPALPAQHTLASTDHDRLLAYVNTYDGSRLLADSIVAPQLARLLAGELDHLKRNLDVIGPIGVQSMMLTLSGNAAHAGGEEDGFLGVSLADGAVYACLLTHGAIEVYAASQPYAQLPDAVRHWILYTWASTHVQDGEPPNVVMHAGGRQR